MKTDLVIPMHEECVNCPNLELETITAHPLYGDPKKVHRCMHEEFCTVILSNLKKQGWKKEGE